MNFVTFAKNGQEYAGVCVDSGYFAFDDLLDENTFKKHGTILDFIRFYENREIPDFAEIIMRKKLRPFENVTIRPPFQPFRDVICLGKNYAEHAKEVVETKLQTQDDDLIPQTPIYFSKSAYPILGDGDEIPLHGHLTNKVDYEVELAVVIGKTAHHISSSEVEDFIFGYTILNDVTARDIQTKHGQWFFGKSLDGFCPIGPHIVPKDKLSFPVCLDICCRVNGEVRQASNTSKLIFDIPYVVAELSKGLTLYPGDIIATGTPAGIGHAMKPPRYLQANDIVECEIKGIGVLRNVFK